MSTANPLAGRDSDPTHDDLGDVEVGWSLFLGVGALTILLGLALIVGGFRWPDSAPLSFGWILLAAGAIELAGSYFARRWIGSVAAVLNGVLYCGVALCLFAMHTDVAGGVMLAVAGLIFSAGLFRLVVAAFKSYTHREITLFNGALGMLIGVMLGVASLGDQIVAAGFLLGVEVIVTGVAWVLFAIVLRQLRRDERSPAGAH